MNSIIKTKPAICDCKYCFGDPKIHFTFILSTTIMPLISSSYQILDAIHLDSQYVFTIGKIWIHSCYKVSYLWGYLWSWIFLLLELENFKVCTNSFNRNWSMQCTVKDESDLITVNFKGRFFGFRDSARVSFQRNLMKKSLLWTSLKCAEEFRLESLTFPAVSWFNRKEMPSSLLLQNSNNFLYIYGFVLHITMCS